MDTDEQPTIEQPAPDDESTEAQDDEAPKEADVTERDGSGGRHVHWRSLWIGAGAVAALVASFLAGMAVQAHVVDDDHPRPPVMMRGGWGPGFSAPGGPGGRGDFDRGDFDRGSEPRGQKRSRAEFH